MLRDRVLLFLKKHRRKPGWLADRAGVPRYSLTAYLGKPNATITEKNLLKLERAMDDWERIASKPEPRLDDHIRQCGT